MPVSVQRIGVLRQAALIRRFVWCLRRRQIQRLELQVKKHLADQEIVFAVKALEELQRNYQWPFQAESLLFKREARQMEIEQTLGFLDALRVSDGVLRHQRFYAGIAFAYAAIQKDDQDRLRMIRPWLIDVASLNQAVEQYQEPRIRNRESRFKQLVSARGCLLQYYFALNQRRNDAMTRAIGESNLSLLEGLNLRKVSADALFRSTSNLMRGLLVLKGDDEQLLRACAQVERLQRTFAERRFRHVIVKASEDHLAGLEVAHTFFSALLTGDICEVRSSWIGLMVNSPAPAVALGAEAWFQRLMH